MNGVERAVRALSDAVSGLDGVDAVGVSSNPLPSDRSEGDIDMFVYCREIPGPGDRERAYDRLSSRTIPPRITAEGETDIGNVKLRTFVSPVWGDADFMEISGVETWVMYFETENVARNFEDILAGKFLDRQDNYYYPVGRLAMFESMTILRDTAGFLAGLKSRLAVYPDELRTAMIARHLGALDDREDLLRAVARKDLPFYHFALDIALDHLFLVLFALNRTYFPSRKRTFERLAGFTALPPGTTDTLYSIIGLGGCRDTVRESYELLDRLVSAVRDQANVRPAG